MVWFYCLFVVCLFSFPVPAVPLYGYGARENDQEYVERREDFNSPLFKPETGFPFGKTLRSSLYVSLLGLDSLGKQPSLKSLGEAPGPGAWERDHGPGVWEGTLAGQSYWHASVVCLQQEVTLWPFQQWEVVAFFGHC